MHSSVSSARSWQNRVSNAQGQQIEREVKRACIYYRINKIADIDKTPEPLQVIKKNKDGTCLVRPTRDKAQPDFKGMLSNGQSVVFEVKSTQKGRIAQGVLTRNQREVLESYYQMGAQSFVCVAIQNQFFMIPWLVWREMKSLYGRKYLVPVDIPEFKVPYRNGIMFLENINKNDSFIIIAQRIKGDGEQ